MKNTWMPISEYHADQCLIGHGSVPRGYKRLVPHTAAAGQWIRRRLNGKYLSMCIDKIPEGCNINSLRKG